MYHFTEKQMEQKRGGPVRTEAARKYRGRRWLRHMEGRNSENRWKDHGVKKVFKQGCAHLRGHQWPPAWGTWCLTPCDSLPAVINTWFEGMIHRIKFMLELWYIHKQNIS